MECAAFDAREKKLDVMDYKSKINSFLKINKVDVTSTMKYSEEEQLYLDDLSWIQSQQTKVNSLQTSMFKRIPQFSSKTFNRFLSETKLQYATKTLIRNELERRHSVNNRYRNMKLSKLKELYLELPLGEEIGVWEEVTRREVEAEHGKMNSWSIEKFDQYIDNIKYNQTIAIKEQYEKLLSNAVTTRKIKPKRALDSQEVKKGKTLEEVEAKYEEVGEIHTKVMAELQATRKSVPR